MKETDEHLQNEIDNMSDLYPYCIVWTRLPLISSIFPTIGHTGICDSIGIINDFAGPYFISINDFAFGKTYQYVKLNKYQINDD